MRSVYSKVYISVIAEWPCIDEKLSHNVDLNREIVYNNCCIIKEMERKIAIIELGGKQHLVSEGTKVVVNKLTDEVGAKLKLTNILNNEPVEVSVISHQKGEKINGLKFKAKARYFKRYGHRQLLTTVEVGSVGGVVKAEPKIKEEAAKTPVKKTSVKPKVAAKTKSVKKEDA